MKLNKSVGILVIQFIVSLFLSLLFALWGWGFFEALISLAHSKLPFIGFILCCTPMLLVFTFHWYSINLWFKKQHYAEIIFKHGPMYYRQQVADEIPDKVKIDLANGCDIQG